MRREGHDPPDADGEAVLAPREARLIEESVSDTNKPVAATAK